jgi:hypothetical protein
MKETQHTSIFELFHFLELLRRAIPNLWSLAFPTSRLFVTCSNHIILNTGLYPIVYRAVEKEHIHRIVNREPVDLQKEGQHTNN